MKSLFVGVVISVVLAVGCKKESAPAPAESKAPANQEPECCCAAKAFVLEDGNVQLERMTVRMCTEDFMGTCEPTSKCEAAPDVDVPRAQCAPLKAGLAVGTTLDALEEAYGDELQTYRVSDNDAAGDYVIGELHEPCVVFTVAFVKDEHRITKIELHPSIRPTKRTI